MKVYNNQVAFPIPRSTTIVSLRVLYELISELITNKLLLLKNSKLNQNINLIRKLRLLFFFYDKVKTQRLI